MKRSEMVDLIFEYMRDPELIYSYQQGDELGIKHMANMCLRAIEEEGMVPPLYVRRLNVDELDELGANNIGFCTGYEHIYDWESEDA